MKRRTILSRKRPLRAFVFTPMSATLSQEALLFYEQGLQRCWTEVSQKAFATETLEQVKNKFQVMLTTSGSSRLTTFDYNEKIILATALQLYTIELLATPPTPQRERQLKECERIRRFALEHPEMAAVRKALG